MTTVWDMEHKADRSQPVAPVPAGYHTVAPWIVARNVAQLIDFLKVAFGAQEKSRVYVGANQIGHAEVRIGDSVVLMCDARPEWPDTPSFIRLYVQDADALFQRALHAGATVVTEMAEYAHGDRVGRVRDPKGNVWWLQTHVRDVTPEQAAKPTERQADAMREALTSFDREMRRRAGS